MQSEVGLPVLRLTANPSHLFLLHCSISIKVRSKNIPVSMWNKQTFSIATDDLSALTQDKLTTVMGALVVDLVSAPITPGTCPIRLNAVMGGIQIFLPSYARVQLNGETFWGGNRVYRGEAFWQEMRKASTNTIIQVPSTPPAWATA